MALAAWIWALAVADIARMGDYGLAPVLGWPFAVALAMLVVAFAWELATPRPRPLWMVVALVLVLFASAPILEALPRLPTTWVHAGFVNYIATHGRVLDGYDARFDWPGFFSLSAVLDTITGRASPMIFMRWSAPAFELSYLAPLLMIAKATVRDERARWIGVALFYACNWVDQDYFSPQALNVLFFLTVIAIVLAFWKPGSLEQGTLGTHRHWWRRVGRVDRVLDAPRQIGIELVIVLLLLASVVSHQFTPYALVIALVACVLARRLPGFELPVLLAVVAIAWLSFATVDFWSGHLSLLFGGAGSPQAALGQNVGKRATGAASHRLIVDLRLVFAAAALVLAGLGALRREKGNRALELLTISPFLLVGGSSYGGEALLRCYLFALPFACLLIGTLICGLVSRNRKGALRTSGIIGLAAVLFVAASWTTVVRGGNDAFESFNSDDRAAVLSVYAVALPGQRLGATTPPTDELPWRDEGVGRWHVIDPVATDNSASIAASLHRERADWVLLTQSEERWGELVGGLAPGWQGAVAADLERDGYVVYQRWPTAMVLRRAAAPMRTISASIPAAS
jgi:hypothetical protein